MHIRLLFTLAGDMSATFSIIRWEDVNNTYGGLSTTKLNHWLDYFLSKWMSLSRSFWSAPQSTCGLTGLSSHGLDSQKSDKVSGLQVVSLSNFQQNWKVKFLWGAQTSITWPWLRCRHEINNLNHWCQMQAKRLQRVLLLQLIVRWTIGNWIWPDKAVDYDGVP